MIEIIKQMRDKLIEITGTVFNFISRYITA